MAYCSKCGFKNEEKDEQCSECGASLRVRAKREKRVEDECFGLPHGGVIAGLLFGIIIILWGISQLPGVLPEGFNFWWLIIIAFGALIIGGALYKLGRR